MLVAKDRSALLAESFLILVIVKKKKVRMISKEIFNFSQLEFLATSLDGKKRSNEEYQCRCPCHDDQKHSLGLGFKNGTLVAHCFAGCSWEDLVREFKRILGNSMNEKVRARPTPSRSNIRALPQTRVPEAIYPYKNADGVLLYEKLRFSGKEFAFRFGEPGRYIYRKPKDEECRFALYNWENASRAARIIICEGEKDVDSLHSPCAVTNDAGAGGWRKEHSQQLKKASEVIILEDNDEAGRKRTQSILRTLPNYVNSIFVVKFEMLPEHGDISEWLAIPGNHDAMGFIDRNKVRVDKGDLISKVATREEYISIFSEILGPMRRDIFSGSLLFKNDEKLWVSVHNYREAIESEIIERDSKGKRFFAANVRRHLAWLESSKKRELIIDVPRWDKKDRIAELCADAILDSDRGITNQCFELLTKEWFSLAFQRLEDPSIRNSIIVVVGPQRIGKDYWINTLVDGLGQFASSLDAIKGDKDSYMALHYSLILKISEFDRTNRGDPGFIKDLITKPSTNLRKSHGVDPQFRWARPSFIASCNPEDFLRDWTGNDRFYIFKIDRFKKEYKNTEDYRMQVVAQAMNLAANKFIAPPWCREQMGIYIDSLTPIDPAEEVVELWLSLIEDHLGQLNDTILKYEILEDRFISNYQAQPILEQICRATGYKLTKVRACLSKLEFLGKNKKGDARGLRTFDRRKEKKL